MAQPNVPECDEDFEQEDLEIVPEDEHVDEDEEEDFGYVHEESDESEGELAAEDEDDEFGPEDDGDPDMIGKLGYSNL